MWIYDNIADDLETQELDEDPERLTIRTEPERQYDPESLLERLRAAPWRTRVRSVSLEWRCQVKDLRLLSAFPNVWGVFSRTNSLASLRGIAEAPGVTVLHLLGDRKRRTALDDLPRTKIDTFEMHYARQRDLEMINSTPSITRLRLKSSDLERMSELASLRLSSLILIHSRFREVADLDAIQEVDYMWLGLCRNLERFTGTTLKLRQAEVDGCGKFDVKSLERAPNLQNLRIAGATQRFRLDDLSRLPALSDLTLAVCKGFDFSDVTLSAGAFPALRKLWINPARDDWMQKLSAMLPEVKVCGGNGKVLYINGIAQPDMQPFYQPSIRS